MTRIAHQSAFLNRTKTMRFHPSVFTGKELDAETGYGYFGARYMDHGVLTMWLSVDPLADKYPNISPYNYCMWNPIKLVDPDGNAANPVFDSTGNYRGCTKEGYTGAIIIYDGDDVFCALSANDLVETTSNCENAASYYSRNVSSKLSDQAKIKIYTHILETANETYVNGAVFCSDDVKIRYDANGRGNWNTLSSGVGANQFILTATDKYIYEEVANTGMGAQWTSIKGCYEATVENIIATVVFHEWYGHYNCKYTGANHYKCYEASKNSTYYVRTTERYKEFIEKRIEQNKIKYNIR